ncbi:MAG TPA: NAD(P)H-quinone oxidoreductase [Mycobacteriales bacterium]|jgi:putative PIG3 family NAD(P)H quinone oxidoreductase|nr:NAD(P)H-quinone oxidoreductase [Mycobacteriales bacterium]
MHAVRCDGAGDVDVLRWGEVPDPTPAAGEVLVEVAASAVNRADLLQRQGFYPPPAGITDVLGLECSGRIAALGPDVAGWAVGDEVCCLLAGGGQAELAVAPAGQCLPVPDGVDLTTAGGLPEVGCTVWSNLVQVGRLAAGEVLLVHGGSSGIGTIAIQVGKALGATVIATAGTAEKLDRCRELGADVAVNYRDDDFVAVTADSTDGHGADVILDIVGAAYLPRNVDALAVGGRLVVIGLQGGGTGELNLAALLAKRAAVHATSLRGRPLAEKAAICAATVHGLWPLIADGRVRPVVGASYPMDQVAQAHRLVADSSHVGKVLLTRPDRP